MPLEPTVYDHQALVRSFFTSEGISKELEECGLVRLGNNELLKLIGISNEEMKDYIRMNVYPYRYKSHISSVAPIISSFKHDSLTTEHEMTHTPLRALKQPSVRYFWKRRMELIDTLIFQDKNLVKHLLNQLTLLITYQITDELRSTFIVEYKKADKNRRQKLEGLENEKITDRLKWPYVSAARIFSHFGKNISLISRILDSCEFATHIYEQSFEKNWHHDEDRNLSPLHHLQKFIIKKDDIMESKENLNQKLEEIIKYDEVEPSFKIENITEPPKINKAEQQIKVSAKRAWLAWKCKVLSNCWQEFDLARLALYHLSDDICRTFLVVGNLVSQRGIPLSLKYYFYIPPSKEKDDNIQKLKRTILAKVMYLLIKYTPTFNSRDKPIFNVIERRGVKIDEKTIIPQIQVNKKAIEVDKDNLILIREELVELLEKYAKETKLDAYYSKKFDYHSENSK